MRIAFDGGAFQQGILGGIYNVACNFLNTYKRAHRDLDVTLVGDTRFGDMSERALAGLEFKPTIVYAPIGPAYDPPPAAPRFESPKVQFLVDGQIVDPASEKGAAIYRGPTPTKTFAVLSRAQTPMGIGLGADDRKLGIAIRSITLSSGAKIRTVALDDRGLTQGFYPAEAALRWTSGAAFIPVERFAGLSETVEVAIEYSTLPAYAAPDGPLTDVVLQLKRQTAIAMRLAAVDRLSSQLRSEGCDIYFANHFIPVDMPFQRTVAWAYDLIPILFPQFFHADAQENFGYNVKLFEKADRVFAISQSTADDLVKHADVSRDMVMNAGIAINPGIARKDPGAIRETLAKYALRQDQYIICVATIEPRKNHLRLLQAYAAARKTNPEFPDLLLVGSMGWDFQNTLSYRVDEKLEGSVKILSDISSHDLASLYSGAKFSVYPSLYEGFGLPVVEAMACGAPVVTSNKSSMKEIGEGAAVLIDPYSLSDLVRGLTLLNEDEGLRARLTAAGYERARSYSWEKVVSRIDAELVEISEAAPAPRAAKRR